MTGWQLVAVRCPTCEGAGVIDEVREVARLAFEPTGRIQSCWTCDGTGIAHRAQPCQEELER